MNKSLIELSKNKQYEGNPITDVSKVIREFSQLKITRDLAIQKLDDINNAHTLAKPVQKLN